MAYTLRYGENPQHGATLIAEDSAQNDQLNVFHLQNPDGTTLNHSILSYINITDTDRVLNTITHIAAAFERGTGKVPYIAAAVKHGHICGAAVGDTTEEVLKGMYTGDSRAVFGGFIMCNFTFGADEAQAVLDAAGGKTYLAGIIAPEITKEAIEVLPKQKRACIYMTLPALAQLGIESLSPEPKRRLVRGGYIQESGAEYIPNIQDIAPELPKQDARDFLLAWAVGSTSVSNTITLVKRGAVIGNGVGQQDRVGACELAIKRARDAGHDIKGALAYSDSFFPFPDGIEVLYNAGITTVFATSGSVKDKQVKAFADERGVNLITVPDSEARGFFGH